MKINISLLGLITRKQFKAGYLICAGLSGENHTLKPTKNTTSILRSSLLPETRESLHTSSSLTDTDRPSNHSSW